MRNIRERERKKRMRYPGGGDPYKDDREEMGEHYQQVQQEMRDDANAPTAVRVFYIVVASVILLLIIVGILGANVFHFW
jgi:hypothetical protein